MTTQEAGEFLAKSKEQLVLSKEEIFSFADTLNYMSDNTVSSAAQLADFSTRIGGLARTVGLSKEANIAFGATLISMGKAPEIAATGIKQLYLEISKGADSKKKTVAFNMLGLDGDKMKEEMAKDAEGTIIKVLERINKLKQSDKSSVINSLFGEQAIDSVTTLVNETETLKENLKKANSEMSKGAISKEYENRMNTLSMKFKQLINNMNTALANLGATLVPALTPIMQSFTKFLIKLSSFIDKHPKLIKSIMMTIATAHMREEVMKIIIS